MVVTCRRDVPTKGQGDAHDITDMVAAALAASSCRAGTVTMFVVGGIQTVAGGALDPGPPP